MLCVPQPFIRFIRAVSAGKDLNPAASRGSALQKWPYTQKGPNSNQKKSYCPKPFASFILSSSKYFNGKDECGRSTNNGSLPVIAL